MAVPHKTGNHRFVSIRFHSFRFVSIRFNAFRSFSYTTCRQRQPCHRLGGAVALVGKLGCSAVGCSRQHRCLGTTVQRCWPGKSSGASSFATAKCPPCNRKMRHWVIIGHANLHVIKFGAARVDPFSNLESVCSLQFVHVVKIFGRNHSQNDLRTT